MSLSTATLKRLPTIKEGLRKGLNREQIAAKCSRTEKTIDRDMSAWVESGLFEVWLKEEFLDLHHYARDNEPMEAYRQISKLVARMLTRKIEAKTEIKTEHVEKHVTIVADYTKAVEAAVNADIAALRARKQMDPTPTHTKTS